MSNKKTLAQKWLGHLRNGTDQWKPFMEYLRRDISEGGLTLADIGTSEEELKKLSKSVA